MKDTGNRKIEKNVDALYVHIPFCEKKCEYCDFCTFVNMSREYEKYTQALVKELKMYPEYEYDTVYFGGGTPSLLPVELLSYIMENIKYRKDGEITLELNPNDMSFEKLKELRKMGINRLSIGIQSFQDHVLKFIGRLHSGEDAIKVFWDAREAGFDNISIDLMFGIPNQSLEDLKKDLETILQLSPENISIYSLIWEEGTVFWSKLQKGILSEIDQDLEAEMYEEIIDFLQRNGYVHYEISNFSSKTYLHSSESAKYIKDYLEEVRKYHFHDTGKNAPFHKASNINTDFLYLYSDGSNIGTLLYKIKQEKPKKVKENKNVKADKAKK